MQHVLLNAIPVSLSMEALAMQSFLDRRNFIRLCSAAAAFMTRAGNSQAPPSRRGARAAVQSRKNFVAIQVRGFGWVDEGVDAVLDNIQHKGDVNTVWAYTFVYGETRLSATLPDHGKSGKSVTGGALYDYDPKYFQDTILKDFRSSEYGKFNVIEEAGPKAKARGLDFFAWDLNNAGAELPRLIPNYSKVTEIDLNGRRTVAPCFNHPDYQAFLRGKVESLLLGYPDRGRHGPLLLPVLPGEGTRAGDIRGAGAGRLPRAGSAVLRDRRRGAPS
jgi:hypothetical protein